jgi:hypothetical protein
MEDNTQGEVREKVQVVDQQTIITALEMLPRFSNPHFLPLQTQIVSREDIYTDGNRGAPHTPGHDAETLEQLNNLLETSLPQYVGLAPDSNGKNKKRRRVTIENANPASEEELVCMCRQVLSIDINF